MSMPEMFKPEQLSPEQKQVFEKDKVEFAEHLNKSGVDLSSRLEYGLDPLAMMVVSDTAPLTDAVAKKLGADAKSIAPVIDELHQSGPWAMADRLAQSTEPAIQSYLVLAAACHEKTGNDRYTPAAYLADRARVINELGFFTADQFAGKKQNIMNRVQDKEVVEVKVNGRSKEIIVASGDPALALAVAGEKGCVTKGGEDRYAQTVKIEDSLLEEAGLEKGYAEMYDPAIGGQKRYSLADAPARARVVWVKKGEVSNDLAKMKPMAKRIWPGMVLTYTNQDLAVQLVAKALK